MTFDYAEVARAVAAVGLALCAALLGMRRSPAGPTRAEVDRQTRLCLDFRDALEASFRSDERRS